eukprot:SAG25_NODE_133_length_14402_cov_15.122142_4_plen_101_part_00
MRAYLTHRPKVRRFVAAALINDRKQVIHVAAAAITAAVATAAGAAVPLLLLILCSKIFQSRPRVGTVTAVRVQRRHCSAVQRQPSQGGAWRDVGGSHTTR